MKKYIEKRSNSFTESGLFLKQFYSLMNNTKFIKNKHQILKEIQNKISKQNHSLKRNNSLKDFQVEFKLKIQIFKICYKRDDKLKKTIDF
jgi:hypothetical protein